MTSTHPESGPAELAGLLRTQGDLTDPAWEQAFRRVPRGLFIPDAIWAPDARDATWLVRVERDDPYWSQVVYSDSAVATQADDGAPDGPGGRGRYVTSSASQPSLVLRMLDALDVGEDSRVLEIGTGTGFNAALLAERLGGPNVVTVEVDGQVAAHARERLAAAGLAPTVVVGDGARGAPSHGPFDRVIATVAAGPVPYAWVAQTRAGGVIVVPWGTPYASTGLLRLVVKEDGTASGPVIGRAGFMWLRQQRGLTGGWRTYVDTSAPVETSASTLDPDDILRMDSPARFAVGLRVPGLCQVDFHASDGSGEYTLWFYDGSGAWASLDYVPGAGEYVVEQHGERRLFDEVEAAYRWWERNGRPDCERFGATVTANGEHVWLDRPECVVS
ncbi:methyltransferase domain-containing protein [Streptomonospora nanhaiensis]|uniref:Protein-L-isoaspartate O-methyltransferase n=1 Tax=Streptomonospora nanhaiensis TaxID=1323731 RepID=A0A853BNU5_9ACTN|nr:methyltransferase domain-containing protein [Streptomonospora nanhaiensis]NYI96843.1 protein-L-isoaspartate(D-aspartate) O-methyltransferase [Streptomonospora nanhaiensis]